MLRAEWLGRPAIRLLAVVVLLTACQFARAQAPASNDTAPASIDAAAAPDDSAAPLAAGEVDRSASRVYVHVYKSGLGHEHAVEGRLAEGRLDLAATERAGVLVFDMTSFAADTDEARKYVGLEGTWDAKTRQQVDDNLRGAAVLDVAKHPTARFEIASVTPLEAPSRRGRPQVQLDGQFTLHGTTQSLRVVAEVVEEPGRTRLRGGFAIKQSDYGIKPFSKAFGAIGVADRLVIFGEIVLGK